MHVKRRRGSLRACLLILMLGVMLPVQALSGMILLSGAQEVQQNAVQKTEQALKGAADAVNAQISSVFQQAHSYLMDRTSAARQAVSFSDASAPSDRWIQLRGLMSELSWIARYNDLVKECRLYYPTRGFSISNDAYRTLSLEEWRRMQETPLSILTVQDGQLLVNASYPAGFSDDTLVLYQTLISLEELRQFAELRLPYGSCLLYQDGRYLAGPEEVPQALTEAPPANGALLTANGARLYAFACEEPLYGFTLVNLIPADTLEASSRSLFALIIVYALLNAAMIVIFAWIFSRNVHRPIRRLLRGFEQLRVGALDVRIEACGPDEFYELTDGFNQTVASLSSAVQTIYDQKTYAQQIRFKQLQAQINPHFLYNTFFMLERLVDDEDMETARAACRYLGEYFRYITYPTSEETLLKEEFAHAMNYLSLQKQRYEEWLLIEADELPENLWDCAVPRLIFQPVLENAFAHGFSSSDARMHMRIRIRTEGESLRFSFENSAQQPPLRALDLDLDSRIPEKETTGMMNIHQRMRLLYGAPYGLSLQQSELGGLRVEFYLPIRRNEAHGDVQRAGRG